MIRDEFIKEQKTKHLSTKELKKIHDMGERAYYASSITKIDGLIKSMNFSTVFTIICAALITAVVVLSVIATKKLFDGWQSYLTFFTGVALYIWTGVWYLLWRPALRRKSERYKATIKALAEKEMEKQRSIYNMLNK